MSGGVKKDVIIIGAGAAGLTAALGLSDSGLDVGVLDGAVCPGAENWSGCVFFGENLAEKDILGKDWQKETAIERKLVRRGVLMSDGIQTLGFSLTDAETFENCSVVLRPVFDRDLAEIARSRGIEFFSSCTALGLIRERGGVIGVATSQGPFYADVVFLAEGDAAHLVSREGYGDGGVDEKGDYLQGIKEVIKLPPSVINERFGLEEGEGAAYEMVIRNARIGGREMQLNMGAFIYTNRESLSIGLVLPLDNLAQNFKGEHNQLMEWFKQIPQVAQWIEGGEREAYGAKIINAGGFRKMSNLCDGGLCIGGAASGFALDFPCPNYTGPASFSGLAFARAIKKLASDKKSFSRQNLTETYATSIRTSRYYEDMQNLQDWASYIKNSDSFFSTFVDTACGTAAPYLQKDLSNAEKIRESSRALMYSLRGKRFSRLMKDLKVQEKASGGHMLNRFKVLSPIPAGSGSKALFKGAEIRYYAHDGERDSYECLPSSITKALEMAKPVIAGAFSAIHRNNGMTLRRRFGFISSALASRKAYKFKLYCLLLMPWLAFRYSLALTGDWLRMIFGGRKAVTNGFTGKYVLRTLQAQEMSRAEGDSCEEKLGDIVYMNSGESHIKVLWPQNKRMNDNDPSRDLWHICPASVYHAEVDVAGTLRPEVYVENCVKCESCWRGSALVDWGRRASHRLQYRVTSTASSTVIRHMRLPGPEITREWQPLPSGVEISDVEIREKLHNLRRRLAQLRDNFSTQRFFLDPHERLCMIERIELSRAEISECLSTLDDIDLSSTLAEGENLPELMSLINISLERIRAFLINDRYFWADAEAAVLEQHILPILGLVFLDTERVHQIEDKAVKHLSEFEEVFNQSGMHKFRSEGLTEEMKSCLERYLKVGDNEAATILELLGSCDLNLATIYLMNWLPCKLPARWMKPLVLAAAIIEEGESGRQLRVPYVCDALGSDYLFCTEEGGIIVMKDDVRIQRRERGLIGLRHASMVEVTIDDFNSHLDEKLSLQNVINAGGGFFEAAVIGAGDYLLKRCLDHASNRIQFPGMFQDNRGNDGIVKFGAVKALISHMTCRLDILRACRQHEGIHALWRYSVAGRFLGTQEGSLTYNATQVFGGSGFSEDDSLSPYYRDASIFKFLLGDPYQARMACGKADFQYLKARGEVLFADLEGSPDSSRFLIDALSADQAVEGNHLEVSARAEADFVFSLAFADTYRKAVSEGNMQQRQMSLALSQWSRVYWQSALSRKRDCAMKERREVNGAFLSDSYEEELVKTNPKSFDYAEFLEKKNDESSFILRPDFDNERYSVENLLADERLSSFRDSLNSAFKREFQEKSFDGMNYVRFAEAQHGHSNEVLDMFHDEGYMRLIIPEELGGSSGSKAEYYLLIMASMQFGDPALSLVIQASTSIGTTPMMLAWKKDIPRALKEIASLQGSKEQFVKWQKEISNMCTLLQGSDAVKVEKKFKALGEEVKKAARNSVFKSGAANFLLHLHEAGQKGRSFDLVAMAEKFAAAEKDLSSFCGRLDFLEDELKARKRGVAFFLSQISSGQTSAFALTEPSAGSDTARVATRAVLKEVEVKAEDGLYTFEIYGDQKVLIDESQCRFEDRKLQVRLYEEDDWSDVCYDDYSFQDDSGSRYFMRDGKRQKIDDFGRVVEVEGRLIYRYYELNGSKMWITNGRFAGVFALYAHTEEGVTGFCVDRYTEGLIIGQDEAKMGQNASPTNEVFLDNVRVSSHYVLGLEGRGQVNALETLNVGRAGLSVSALSLSEDMLSAARDRSVNTTEHQALLGQMAAELRSAEPSAYEMVGLFDRGQDARIESAIGKFMNSELLHRMVLYSEAVFSYDSQTFDCDVEKKKRDARILNIYEGTNEIQRFLILKDLIALASKNEEIAPFKVHGMFAREMKIWDDKRHQFWKRLKQAQKDCGVQSWLNAELQPVFFLLSETCAWLKYIEGCIWRLHYWQENLPESLKHSLLLGFEYGLQQFEQRLHLYDHDMSRLEEGIRPPEILLADELLQLQYEELPRGLSKPLHLGRRIKVAVLLDFEPLNLPLRISEGELLEDSAHIRCGEIIQEALRYLPENAEVVLWARGPEPVRQLASSIVGIDELVWLDTGSTWPLLGEHMETWHEHLERRNFDVFLVQSGSSAFAMLLRIARKLNLAVLPDVDDFSFFDQGAGKVMARFARDGEEVECAMPVLMPLRNFVRSVEENRRNCCHKITRIELEVRPGVYFAPEVSLPKNNLDLKCPKEVADYLRDVFGATVDADIELPEILTTSEISNCNHLFIGLLKENSLDSDSLRALAASAYFSKNDLSVLLLLDEGISPASAVATVAGMDLKKVWLLTAPANLLDYPAFCSDSLRLIIPPEVTLYCSQQQAPLMAGIAGKRRFIQQVSSYSRDEGGYSFDVVSQDLALVRQVSIHNIDKFALALSPQKDYPLPEGKPLKVYNLNAVIGFPQSSLYMKSILQQVRGSLGIDRLTDAEFVLDVGYGIADQDTFDAYISPLLKVLEDKGIDVSVGGSRKMIESLKILPGDKQIGQSGVSVKPKVLLAVGVSGAPQHMSGISPETIVLCFNKDASAPLMTLNERQEMPRVYPIVGDLRETIVEVTSALSEL